MKRIKILFSTLLSALSLVLCFAMTGCTSDGTYVKDSLDYSFIVSFGRISVDYSFEVTTPDITNYTVNYTLTAYNGTAKLQELKKSKTVSASQSGTSRVRDYLSDEFTYFDGAQEENLSLKISDVTVTPKEQNDKYQSYAIGFGTAGGVVLIACTVLFIVLKLKERK